MPSFRQRFADIGRAFRGNPLDNPAVPLSQPAAWMFDIFGGASSAAGVAVNEKTSMQETTFYACINVLASDFSSLPCRVYEMTQKGRMPAFDSDLYYLLAVEPNPEMSAVVFWGAMMACAATRGNGYALIQWDSKAPSVPVALWPLHPQHVQPKRNSETKKLEYHISVGGETKVYPPKDVLHVPALTMDGWLGLDPISHARQSIGIGIQGRKHIGAFFGRGSRPSGVLTRTVAPTPQGTMGGKPTEANDSIRESWERANSGDNQGRTAVLPAGWDWKPISLTPDQAQFLEIMQYTRTEIAGLFRIPPHMVGDTSRLSNSNHESQALEYVTFTLRPWLTRFEAEIQRKLMPRTGRKANRYSVRFDVSELLRGDFASQMNGFAIGKQWGFFNTDMILEKLGENPIGGPAGKQFLVPLNMVPAESISSPDPEDDETDVTPDGNQEGEPAGNGGRNQRMLLNRMATAYAGLFRDAAGRLEARSMRDAAAVQQIFGPVLSAIAEEAQRQALRFFRLHTDIDLGTEKILRDAAKAIEKRASSWTATTVDDDAAQELLRTVRSITLNVFREAGSTLALAA